MELTKILMPEDLNVKEQKRASRAKRSALTSQIERLQIRLAAVPAMREQAMRQEAASEEMAEQCGTGFRCLTLESVDQMEAVLLEHLSSAKRLLRELDAN